MSMLDVRLRLQLLEARAPLDAASTGPGLAGRAAPMARGQRVDVAVEFTGDLEAIVREGLAVNWSSGNAAAGTIDLADLEAVAALDNVLFVHAARRHRPGLNDSVPEIRADR